MRSISEYVDMGLDVATADHGSSGGALALAGAAALGAAAVALIEIVRTAGDDLTLRTWQTPGSVVPVCTYPSTPGELNTALGQLSVEELERLEVELRSQEDRLRVEAIEDYEWAKAEALEKYEAAKRRVEEVGDLKSEVSLAIDMHTPIVLPPQRIVPRATPIGMAGWCRAA